MNVRLADLLAAVVGLKTTFRVQDAAAASVEPQVLPLVENSAAFAPVKAMLVIFSVAVPLLVNVTALFPLDVFTV